MYESSSGTQSAKAELAALPRDAKAAIAAAMKRVQRGEANRDDVKKLNADIYEIRVQLGTNPYRLLYAHEGEHDQVLLALTALYKNTKKTPPKVIKRAERRLADWNAH